ncbi:MAG TPA: DUF542 domain-containing protein [Flavihumibacter sp.]|nr:DUF542 domain-containing protein [Flavihumibacter sp.]HPZ86962.1 DUF542 domain-containing protein [Flavihumibacter sp.]HQD09707.1 DUF542 domain-containing protein [Flavihumibacter sp.]
MHLKLSPILPTDTAQSLVRQDYRMAAVFRRHGMAYCCGAKWPLDMLCNTHGVSIDELIKELTIATRNQGPSPLPDYSDWEIDFLVKYMVKVFHSYFRKRVPEIGLLLNEFVVEHEKKYAYCGPLALAFKRIEMQLPGQLDFKEHTIYPYITRVANGLTSDASYARLLVRTLRKPLADVLERGASLVTEYVDEIHALTDSYTLPHNACASHRVVFASLQELDQQLNEYLFIEQTVLFPRAIQMEKQLLEEV